MAAKSAFKRARAAAGVSVAGLALAVGLLGSHAVAEDAAGGDSGAEPFVLGALGDSLTAGYGLPVEEGFTPVLSAWLEAQGAGPVTVINAGVSGDTTSGGLARLDWSLGPEVDGVLLELGANDALRGVDPAIARENLDAIMARLAERGVPVLIAGMYAPRNWGDAYVSAFESIYPDLAAKYDAPLYPFFLEGVAGEPSLNQSDGIHPNAEGVRELVKRIGPAVRAFIDAARAEASAAPS